MTSPEIKKYVWRIVKYKIYLKASKRPSNIILRANFGLKLKTLDVNIYHISLHEMIQSAWQQ